MTQHTRWICGFENYIATRALELVGHTRVIQIVEASHMAYRKQPNHVKHANRLLLEYARIWYGGQIMLGVETWLNLIMQFVTKAMTSGLVIITKTSIAGGDEDRPVICRVHYICVIPMHRVHEFTRYRD